MKNFRRLLNNAIYIKSLSVSMQFFQKQSPGGALTLAHLLDVDSSTFPVNFVKF